MALRCSEWGSMFIFQSKYIALFHIGRMPEAYIDRALIKFLKNIRCIKFATFPVYYKLTYMFQQAMKCTLLVGKKIHNLN